MKVISMNARLWNCAAILGIAALLALGGCGNSTKPIVSGDPPPVGHAVEDGHLEGGPHHGHLIELGKEDYHAELTHDETTHTVTIYLLDSSAKESVPIEAAELLVNLASGEKPAQYSLPAMPDSSDPTGKSSRFQLQDEALCDSICAPQAKGRVNVQIAGKPYSGVIEKISHEGHAHKHNHAGHEHK